MHIGIELNQGKVNIAKYSQDTIEILWEEVLSSDSPEDLTAMLAECLIPIKSDSVCVNIPSHWGLKLRNQLFSFLQNYAFHIHIIPTPLAAFVNYVSQGIDVSGDSLWIHKLAKTNDYEIAFVNYMPLTKEIILESYFVGSEEELTDEASRLNIYRNKQWKLRQMICANIEKLKTTHIFKELTAAGIPILKGSKSDVLTGLCSWNKIIADLVLNLKIIYPRKFFREITNRITGLKEWRQIHFDTRNIELDLYGRYKICTFPSSEKLHGNNQKEINIWESACDKDILYDAVELYASVPIAKEHLISRNVPSTLELYWDINAGELELRPGQLSKKQVAPTDSNKIWLEIARNHERQTAFLDSIPQINSPSINDYNSSFTEIEFETGGNPPAFMNYIEKKLTIIKLLHNEGSSS